ncbi:hypothetical protein FOZ62_017936 [Perkinsus olseni]|uniref:N-acetyltransferase domain-containing protein n=1 Tax=Perkinsus olseni TaxID=32597 RepID=A0A7J6SQH3_PEROL|nr:hypothetical protein FOZ62_017936 [Perkinsus olseni]
MALLRSLDENCGEDSSTPSDTPSEISLSEIVSGGTDDRESTESKDPGDDGSPDEDSSIPSEIVEKCILASGKNNSVYLFALYFISLRMMNRKGPFTPDASALEYRLANSSDTLITDKINPTAGVFLAIDPNKNVVVGSAEFGLVNDTDGTREEVYITEEYLRKAWRRPGLPSKMLEKLLEYCSQYAEVQIHNRRPQVTFAWVRLGRSDEFITGEVKKAGFERCDSNDWEYRDFCYEFPDATENNPPVDDGPFPVIPAPSDD